MLDHFHIPIVPGRDVQIFNDPGQQGDVDSRWTTWTKPRGLSMAHIFMWGGGGGGGKGLAGIAGGARGGGGGGGGSGQSVIVIPLEFLPDKLFLFVGKGGEGAFDPATNATAGSQSFVAIHPEQQIVNMVGNAIGGGAGSNGSGAGNAAAGTGGTLASIQNNMPLVGLGHVQLFVGQTGSTGGSPTTAGTALALPVTGLLCMGGTGGGGVTLTTNFAGGAITAITGSLLSQNAPAAAPAGPGGHGSSAMLWKPLFSFSGMGGSSSDSVIPSGNGGNAFYGSGGGGGGGGIGDAIAQNSPGGAGGVGLIIISCW